MSKLLEQGGFGCVFHPRISCSGKSTNINEFVSKLQRKNYNSENEIKIGKTIIKKIKNYSLFFIPVLEGCDINISSINESLLKKCEIIRKDDVSKYVLMKLKYIKNIDFHKFLIDPKETKEKVFINTLETYLYLLESIKKLSEINIIHFDLKTENILYDLKTRCPLIIDFGISLNMNEYSYSKALDYFYIYAPEYYIWPLEVHILCYVVNKRLDPKGRVNKDELNKIVEKVLDRNKGLEIFSPDFNKQYKDSCLRFVSQYAGLTKIEIMKKIIQPNNFKTWDNYALSILMLRMLFYLFNKGYSSAPFIIAFSQLLLMGIHPIPERRFSVDKMIVSLNKIINTKESMNDLNLIVNSIHIDHNTISSQIEKNKLKLPKTD